MKGRLVFGGGRLRPQAIVVRLVDGDHVGQFENALLDPLQFVAGAGQHQHEEEIGQVGHRRFGLADAHRLDQDHVEPGGLAEQHRLAGLGRDAAERAGRRGGADEGVRIDRELAPCGSCRRGSRRRCGSRWGRPPEPPPCGPAPVSRLPRASMAVDLPTPGTPVMPTRTALPGSRHQRLQQVARLRAVVGAAGFHQRDGARQHGAVAAGDGVRGDVGLAERSPRS